MRRFRKRWQGKVWEHCPDVGRAFVQQEDQQGSIKTFAELGFDLQERKINRGRAIDDCPNTRYHDRRVHGFRLGEDSREVQLETECT